MSAQQQSRTPVFEKHFFEFILICKEERLTLTVLAMWVIFAGKGTLVAVGNKQ